MRIASENVERQLGLSTSLKAATVALAGVSPMVAPARAALAAISEVAKLLGEKAARGVCWREGF
ncbi:MAG: hypothetical protein DRN96_06035 [Thermoproteota archaeon]|nr:MAG: hypothetical protein DRN96_06035 [Candidatus Korarchaeota archaeon]RLG54791.1 MAG: hypothetical protein DRN99_04520 [Candidatus Korarchaeota archaeon]